jgi:hypothetical protein
MAAKELDAPLIDHPSRGLDSVVEGGTVSVTYTAAGAYSRATRVRTSWRPWGHTSQPVAVRCSGGAIGTATGRPSSPARTTERL